MRPAAGPPGSHSATPQAVINVLDHLPLVFEENRGQFDASVRYAARTSDGDLFLTSTGTTTSLRRDARKLPKTIRMRFAGSHGAQSMLGEDVVEATSNYYIGDDATTWHADVPHFQRVRARAVYPGIDVVYYGSGPALEYYFVVEPHADPGRIDLAFSGVDTIEIDRSGDLVLRAKHATITHGKPVAYHATAGERRAVEAHFVKRGAGHVGIRIARYDREKPLVIDPLVLLHATYLGGSSTDKILGIAADPDGSTYVTGLTQSPDFPTLNAFQAGSGGATDVFVAKINAAGTALIYSTYIGGNAIDAALGIARDTSGNAYVAGYTASSNFPVTANPLQASLNGSAYDAFVAKLGPTGALQYSTYLGGTDIDMANAIAVDGAGNAHVTGVTCSPDFPTVNAFQPALNGAPNGCFAGKDAFVSKLDTGGNALVYSTYFGGSDQDEANGIAVDTQGRASITGYTWSNNLPIAGLALSALNGSADAFVGRFGTTGALDYSTYYGGADYDEGAAIAVDAKGSLYVTGLTESTDFPTVHAFQNALQGGGDAFVFKLAIVSGAPSSAAVPYSSFLGGSDDEMGRAIAADSNGNAYVAGYTTSSDFPIAAPAQPMLQGSQDAFVARLSPNGALAFSTYLGGNDEDDAWGIALSNGTLRGVSNIDVAGTTLSTDLATGSVLQPIPRGLVDGFVAKIGYVP